MRIIKHSSTSNDQINLHSKARDKLSRLCNPAIVNSTWSFDSNDKGEQLFRGKIFMLYKSRWCEYVDFNHSVARSQVVQSDWNVIVTSTNKLRSGGTLKVLHIEQSTVQDDAGRLGSFIKRFLLFQFIKNSSALYNLSANNSDQQLVSPYSNNVLLKPLSGRGVL